LGFHLIFLGKSCSSYIVVFSLTKIFIINQQVKQYEENNSFNFTIPNKSFLNPVIEHVLFDGKGKVYNFPLFVEDIYKFNSTYLEEENRSNSFNSYHSILNWWKENGKTTTLDKIMNNKTKLIDL